MKHTNFKHCEVFSIRKHCACWYTVTLYSRLGGYWDDITFEGYTRKQVIYKLRHEYGLTVPAAVC